MQAPPPSAKGIALLAGKEQMDANSFKEVLSDYQSPVYPQQIEYQILQAVQESTSKSLIPERWRLDPESIARRIEELRMYIELSGATKGAKTSCAGARPIKWPRP